MATLTAKSLLELPARVARTLLMLADDRGTSILALSLADLADMLGVTCQSLNGQLPVLVRYGILVLWRGRSEIRDRGALGRAEDLRDRAAEQRVNLPPCSSSSSAVASRYSFEDRVRA
ncbi:MAG: helix-turn-helix domain-containing protein [Rubrivivax sp.]